MPKPINYEVEYIPLGKTLKKFLNIITFICGIIITIVLLFGIINKIFIHININENIFNYIFGSSIIIVFLFLYLCRKLFVDNEVIRKGSHNDWTFSGIRSYYLFLILLFVFIFVGLYKIN